MDMDLELKQKNGMTGTKLHNLYISVCQLSYLSSKAKTNVLNIKI